MLTQVLQKSSSSSDLRNFKSRNSHFIYEFFMHTLLSKIGLDAISAPIVLALISEYTKSAFLIFCIFPIPVEESKQEIMHWDQGLANFLRPQRTQSKEVNLFELFIISLSDHKPIKIANALKYIAQVTETRAKSMNLTRKNPTKQTSSHVIFISA